MKIAILIFLTLLFFSCHSNKTEKYQEEEVIQRFDTVKIEQIKIQTH